MGVSFPEDLTKEQGIRLIGTLFEARDYQKEILKFFKIKYDKKITQTRAQDLIDEIFSNEDNKINWKAKLDSIKLKENLVKLKFFNVEIPKNITIKISQDVIKELFEDEEKEKQWNKRIDEIETEKQLKEDRKEEIKELLYLFNSDRLIHECEKIPQKLFLEFIEGLETEGHKIK